MPNLSATEIKGTVRIAVNQPARSAIVRIPDLNLVRIADENGDFSFQDVALAEDREMTIHAWLQEDSDEPLDHAGVLTTLIHANEENDVGTFSLSNLMPVNLGFLDNRDFSGLDPPSEVRAPDFEILDGERATLLETDDDGFEAGNWGIGFTKKFNQLLNANGAQSISYWVKSLEHDVKSSVAIEFRLADGTRWTQRKRTPLSISFAETVLNLNALDFFASERPNPQIVPQFDLSEIDEINFLLFSNGQTDAVKRRVIVDKIAFSFRSFTLEQSALLEVADGMSQVTVTAQVLGLGQGISNQEIRFEFEDESGAVIQSEIVTTNEDGQAASTFTAREIDEIVIVKVTNISDNSFTLLSSAILLNKVEDFEDRQPSGGSSIRFGDENGFFEVVSDPVQHGAAALRLQTDANGFTSADSFFGFQKLFSQVIDASKFPAIFYWLKESRPGGSASVALQFVAENGNIWEQKHRSSPAAEFSRIQLQLAIRPEHGIEDFVLVERVDTVNFAEDLKKIIGINIVVFNTGDPGSQGGAIIDDIIFGPNISVCDECQTALFARAESGEAVGLLADIGLNIPAHELEFSLVNGGGNLDRTLGATDLTGTVPFTYLIGSEIDIAEIQITSRDDPLLLPVNAFVMQSVIENFEHGNFAGGHYVTQTSDEESANAETAFRVVTDGSFGSTDNKVGNLQTGAQGFANPNSVVTFSKRFTRPIDLRNIPAISYRVKGQSADNQANVALQLELEDGKIWTQRIPSVVTQEVMQTIVNLDTRDFFISEAGPVGSTPLMNLSAVSALNLLLTSNGSERNTLQEIHFDDIQSMNQSMSLEQSSIFALAAGGEEVTFIISIVDLEANVQGQRIEFTFTDKSGNVIKTDRIETDSNGRAQTTFQITEMSDVITLDIGNQTHPTFQSIHTHILQNIVDDFEHGLTLGGTWEGFGPKLGSFALTNNDVRSGEFALELKTSTQGFTAEAPFIGVSKVFSQPIDVSQFPALSFWVKNNLETTQAFIRVELISEDGITWTQNEDQRLTQEFSRIHLVLKDPGEPNLHDFTSPGRSKSELEQTLSNLKKINLVLVNKDAPGSRGKIVLDDIRLGPSLSICTTCDHPVFVQAGSDESVTITADIGMNLAGHELDFSVISGDGSLNTFSGVTEDNGKATLAYTAGVRDAIVEIQISSRTEPELPSVTAFVMQSLIEDFEHGPRAGGIHGSFELKDSSPLSKDIEFDIDEQLGLGKLEIVANGGATDATVYGYFKKFSHPIDIHRFSHISYKIQGNGGALRSKHGIQLHSTNGNVWEQTKVFDSLPSSLQNFLVNLERAEFVLVDSILGPENENILFEFRQDLESIERMNIILKENGDFGNQGGVFLDDIAFRPAINLSSTTILVNPDGKSEALISASLGLNVPGHKFEFVLLSGDGRILLLNENGETNHEGNVHFKYISGTEPGIYELQVSSITNPDIPSASLFIMQGMLENFEHDLEIGGVNVFNGFPCTDDACLESDPQKVFKGMFSGKLQTGEVGFTKERIFIRYFKEFIEPIDPFQFDTISYAVRSEEMESESTVALEFLMQDDEKESLSTWTQNIPSPLSTEFTIITKRLTDEDFTNFENPFEELKDPLKIKQIRIVLYSSGFYGSPGSIIIDDIQLGKYPVSIKTNLTPIFLSSQDDVPIFLDVNLSSASHETEGRKLNISIDPEPINLRKFANCETNVDGEFRADFNLTTIPGIVEIILSHGEIPTLFPTTKTYVLRDFIDRYEHGFNAGGEHIFFTPRNARFDITENPEKAEDFSASLGYGPLAQDDESSLLFGKRFKKAIDASSFNAISYGARTKEFNSDPKIRVQLIVQEGDTIRRFRAKIPDVLNDQFQIFTKQINPRNFCEILDPFASDCLVQNPLPQIERRKVKGIDFLVFVSGPVDDASELFFDDIRFNKLETSTIKGVVTTKFEEDMGGTTNGNPEFETLDLQVSGIAGSDFQEKDAGDIQVNIATGEFTITGVRADLGQLRIFASAVLKPSGVLRQGSSLPFIPLAGDVTSIEPIEIEGIPKIGGMIDDFVPEKQYNLRNRNDRFGFTDDDGTMGEGNTRDRVDANGVLTLEWDHQSDYWFTFITERGADLRENAYLQFRARGNQSLFASLQEPSGVLFHQDIELSQFSSQMTTINLPLNGFRNGSLLPNLGLIEKLFLRFFDSSGFLELDSIHLSPYRHPNTIEIGTDESNLENDELGISISLFDEFDQPLGDFGGRIELEISNGVIDPPFIDGFDPQGQASKTFKVFGNGSQSLIARDVVGASKSTSVNLKNIDLNIDEFEVVVPENSYGMASFPIEITAKDINDIPVPSFGDIVISSENNGFLPNSDPMMKHRNGNTFTIYGSVNTLGQTSLKVELAPPFGSETIFGRSNPIIIRDGSDTEGEVQFILGQQEDNGLIDSTHDSSEITDTSHLFTNALSIIALTHKGLDDRQSEINFIEKARNILSGLKKAERPAENDVNFGGFFDAYDGLSDASKPRKAVETVTTGNNAWLLMAINYYTLHTGDSQFLDMAIEIGTLLQNRQQIEEEDSPTFGGIYSRENQPGTFLTEHQAEAFSGLFYLSKLPGLLEDEQNRFFNSAQRVKEFILKELFTPGTENAPGFFALGLGTLHAGDNIALDALSAPFLGLLEQFRSEPSSFSPTFPSVLDYAYANFGTTEIYLDREIFGTKFMEKENVNEQHVWIEGSAQLALALNLIRTPDTIPSEENTRQSKLLENAAKVRHFTGGYPTLLAAQYNGPPGSDGDPRFLVGRDDINIAPTAWMYFNKVDPPINPYVASIHLEVRKNGMGEIFPSGKKEVERAVSIPLQAIPDPGYAFEVWTGDTENLLDPNSSQTTISLEIDARITATFVPAPLEFVLDEHEIQIVEGTTSVVRFKLSAIPAQPVVAMIVQVSGDSDIFPINANEFTFTPQTWDVFQEIVMFASEDNHNNGDDEAQFRIEQQSGLNPVNPIEFSMKEQDDDFKLDIRINENESGCVEVVQETSSDCEGVLGETCKNPIEAIFIDRDQVDPSIILCAQPAKEGWKFDSWEGDFIGLEPKINPLMVTLDANKSLTANFIFAPDSPVLEILQPDGFGDVPDLDHTIILSWTSFSDLPSSTQISFFADVNGTGFDKNFTLREAIPFSERATIDLDLDSIGINEGDYFVWGEIDDGVNTPVLSYSSGRFTVPAVAEETSINCILHSSSIKFGQSIPITSRVTSRIAPDEDIITPILFQFQKLSEPLANALFFVSTNENDYRVGEGATLTTFSPPGVGTWQVSTSWEGNDSNQPSRSEVKTFEVEQAETELDLIGLNSSVHIDNPLLIRGQLKLKTGISGNTISLEDVEIKLVFKNQNGIEDTPLICKPGKFGQFPRTNDSCVYRFNKHPADPGEGIWTLEARFAGNENLAASQKTIPIQVTSKPGYAILCQGRFSATNKEGNSEHAKTLSNVYNACLAQDLAPDDIRFLAFDDTGIDIPGRDLKPSKDNFRDSIEKWAVEKLQKAPAPLFIVLVNHGSIGKFHIENDELTPVEFDIMLDNLQKKVKSSQPIVIVLGMCHSGSFITPLSLSSTRVNPDPNRIIISSSDIREVSHRGPQSQGQDNVRDGEFFVTSLFRELALGKNLHSAFSIASSEAREFTKINRGEPFNEIEEEITDDFGFTYTLEDFNDRGDGLYTYRITISSQDVPAPINRMIFSDFEVTSDCCLTAPDCTEYLAENTSGIECNVEENPIGAQNGTTESRTFEFTIPEILTEITIRIFAGGAESSIQLPVPLDHTNRNDNSPQHALLDDNGDGKATHFLNRNPSENEDGSLASTVFLGVSTNESVGEFEIESVHSAQTIMLGELPEIFAAINRIPGDISAVWVEIKSPEYSGPENPEGISNQHDMNLIDFITTDAVDSTDNGKDRSRWTWGKEELVHEGKDIFNQPGIYQILYYAMTGANVVARGQQSWVFVTSGGEHPSAFALRNPEDDSTHSGTILFHWEPSVSPFGPVQYLLQFKRNTISGPEQIIESNLLDSTFLLVDHNLVPDGNYFWSVTAVDTQGNTTQSASRTVEVDHDNDPTDPNGSLIWGWVRDTSSKKVITGTNDITFTVSAPGFSGGGTVENNGRFLFPGDQNTTYIASFTGNNYITQEETIVVPKNPVPQFLVFQHDVFLIPKLEKKIFQFAKGWNFFSLPLIPSNPGIDEIFKDEIEGKPIFTGKIWTWENHQYIPITSLQHLIGYWMYSPSFKEITITGTPLNNPSVDLLPGWNIVGPTIHKEPPQSLPNFFGWESGTFIDVRNQPPPYKGKLRPQSAYLIYVPNPIQLGL